MEDYQHTGGTTEFNPRASPPYSTAADHNSRWAPLNSGAQFSAHPSQPDPNSLHHAAPRWWVSPSRSFTPTAVYGGARQLPDSLGPLDHSRLSVYDTGVASGRFAVDLNRNNPYLDTVLRSPSASWRQQMRQPHGIPNCSGADDWSCNGSFSSHPAATTYPQAARTSACDHDQDPASAYPVAQAPTSSSHSFPQLASANGPPGRLSYGDGNFKVGEDTQYGWANADHQVRNVGKSQSMRALFEENAALRRALNSMRRGSFFALPAGPDHQVLLDGDQNRHIVSDIAEGRALSMRERGRWAMTQAAAAAAGEVVDSGVGGNCCTWAGTPRQPWAAPAAGQPLHGGASIHRHHRTAYHPSHSWGDAAVADRPLFSYGVGSFGGWPEEFMSRSRSDCSHWADVHNDQCQGGPGDELRAREGTSLQQLLVEADRGGMINGHKWRRPGKKKLAPPSSCEEAEGKHADSREEEGGSQCAMCGGKLRSHGAGGKKGGLPLRLCGACHPRAAASLPQSTLRSPPVTTAQVRQHVGTAIFMACRPNGTNEEMKDPSTKRVKPAKKRIAELCRQFVGLATGKSSEA